MYLVIYFIVSTDLKLNIQRHISFLQCLNTDTGAYVRYVRVSKYIQSTYHVCTSIYICTCLYISTLNTLIM